MPHSRPSIQARDSSGRQVSLLNDDYPPSSPRSPVFLQQLPHPANREFAKQGRSNSYASIRSAPPSPSTPDLLRSHSYDSQATQDPISPITPTSILEFGRLPYPSVPPSHFAPPSYEHAEKAPTPYHDYAPNFQRPMITGRPSYSSDLSARDEGSTAPGNNGGNSLEKGTKRYPCRFRESHGCEKTFTTSGHASRHSKIHTAEKAVHCSFAFPIDFFPCALCSGG